jgi:hypothetical protein
LFFVGSGGRPPRGGGGGGGGPQPLGDRKDGISCQYGTTDPNYS